MFRGKIRHWLFVYFADNGWNNYVVLSSDKKEAERHFLKHCEDNEITVDLYAGYKCSYKWFIRKNLTDVFTA